MKERDEREIGQHEVSAEGMGGTRWGTHAVTHTHTHTHTLTHRHTHTLTHTHMGGVWR